MLAKLRATYQQWVTYKNNTKAKSGLKYFLLDTGEAIAFALVMALLIRQFIVQVSVVPSPSMVPTLMVGDRLFVDKLSYRFFDPHRGDIVVFKSPTYDTDKKDFVKRLIGMPGDSLRIVDGDVYINGKLLVVPGVNILKDHFYFSPIEIPKGKYFMMGDNRGNSYDSRYWGFVPREDIKGKGLFTFWPFTRMRPLQ